MQVKRLDAGYHADPRSVMANFFSAIPVTDSAADLHIRASHWQLVHGH